jgi:hypothetical protein
LPHLRANGGIAMDTIMPLVVAIACFVAMMLALAVFVICIDASEENEL